MKTAFLYAGQGSQKVGMGRDFYDNFPSARAIYDAAGDEIISTSFDDPNGVLSQTEFTQPCMVTFTAAVTTLFFERGIVPSAVAGLSLGEYSALFAAGVFDAQTAIELVSYRGKIMRDAAAGMQSAMVAVMGLDLCTAEDIAAQIDGAQIANINCTGQIVLGGEKSAVENAAQMALKQGARRCIPLNVSGPFHTSYMSGAAELLRKKLQQINLNPPKIPILFNVTGGEIPHDMSICDALCTQIQSTVQFEKIIKNLQHMGIERIVEIGPGRVLSGFVKKTAPEINTICVENTVDFAVAADILEGK